MSVSAQLKDAIRPNYLDPVKNGRSSTAIMLAAPKHGPLRWIERRDDVPIPDGVAYEEWEQWGKVIRASDETITWKLARWIHYGERFQLTSAKFAEASGLSTSTVRKLRALAAMAIAFRDRYPELSKLPWSSFQALSAKNIPDGIKIQILREAASGGFGTQCVVQRLKEWQQAHNQGTFQKNSLGCKPKTLVDGQVPIYITEDEWRKLSIIATKSGHGNASKYLKSFIRDKWIEEFPVVIDEDAQMLDGSLEQKEDKR